MGHAKEITLQAGDVTIPVKRKENGRLTISLAHAAQARGLMHAYKGHTPWKFAQIIGLDEDAEEVHYVL